MKRLLVATFAISLFVPAPAAIAAASRLQNGHRAAATVGAVASEQVDGCGERPAKADGTLWSCTFDDEFNGVSLNRTKWVPQTRGFATGTATAWACYQDSPSNIAVSEGTLKLTLRKGDAKPCPGWSNAVTPFTSGMVSTYRTWSQQYGRFEARFKTTAATTTGLHEAFWLWPDDRQGVTTTWPESGEIDIAEIYSAYPNLVVPRLHSLVDLTLGAVLTGPQTNTAYNCRAKRGVFNTYTLEWAPQRIEILVNGVSCMVNTSGDPAFAKKYIINLTQALGDAMNPYTSTTPMPATMSVDYIRVWS